MGDGGLAGLRVVARYDDPLRTAIRAFKYRGQRGLAQPLGSLLASHVKLLASETDVVVPVPLHSSRERQRGYNQAMLLASACVGRTGLPVERNVLCRTHATRPQVGLGAAARRENVAHAFVATPRGLRALTGKRVLLVDDVTTSGATLEAAAAALRRVGVASVWGLALAQPSFPADGSKEDA
jgi:ComF family protein